MKFKYLRVTTSDMMWGKQELTKEYLLNVKSNGDALIDLDDMTYFDAEENAWVPVDGDK